MTKPLMIVSCDEHTTPPTDPMSILPAVRERRVHLVDGKLATWYGPRIAHALRELPRLIAGA